jgi:molecular chaperone DnaJ
MDPLQVLGLKIVCSLDDAKKRWRQLSQDTHPDHNPDDPEAPTKFRMVQDAYTAIKADPTLLEGTVVSNDGYLPSIRITVPVTIEDFYFARMIPVKISRQIYCSQCNGTGSQTKEAGVCQHCSGTGQVKSKLLNMMDRSSICPVCRGMGVPEKNICVKCKGIKYETETFTRKVKLSPKWYHKKSITLKYGGHQIDKDIFSNAFVKLDIQPDNRVIIEDDYFKVYQKVSPIQKILGDTSKLVLFGRVLPYRIDKNSVDTMIIDRVTPELEQRVRIVFIETPVILTEETLPLYKKILSIEKRLRHE